jgi:hypothetical protein
MASGLDREDIQHIVVATVSETLLRMGLDVSTPEAVKGLQADFLFVRRQRKAAEAMRANAMKTLFYVAAAVSVGFITWLVTGLVWKVPHP